MILFVRTCLLASSFILQVSSIYLTFRIALQNVLQDGGLRLVEHRQDVFWTLQSMSDAGGFLMHAFGVYVPEVPYKSLGSLKVNSLSEELLHRPLCLALALVYSKHRLPGEALATGLGASLLDFLCR